MSCTHPFHAFPTGRKTENGKDEYFLSFSGDLVIPPSALERRGIFISHPLTDFIEVPCGQCYMCKKEKARKWSFRCLYEAMEHEENYFLTLTYDDEHLPKDGMLKKKDLQDFFKRLRHYSQFRYFACGEYGEKGGRPHYHVLAFGLHLERLIKFTGGNMPLYRSELLEKLWPFGFVSVGIARPSACGNYIAKYTIKQDHGKGFLVMSRKPGIGFEPMLREVMEDNPNPNAWKMLTLGDGRGNVLSGSVPRSLRERLGMTVSDEITRACIIKTQNKMRAAGYSDDEVWNIYLVEQFRETEEHLQKKAEVARNLGLG